MSRNALPPDTFYKIRKKQRQVCSPVISVYVYFLTLKITRGFSVIYGKKLYKNLCKPAKLEPTRLKFDFMYQIYKNPVETFM